MLSAVRTLALLALLTLGACGFQPVYGTKPTTSGKQATVVSDLGAINISPIADRSGQLLRNSLRDKLTPRGVPARPAYRLDVGLKETRSDLVILKDSTSTFSKVRFQASFVLVDLRSNEPVHRGRAESTTTFNRVDSDFAILAAERDARRRAADEISEDIRLRLGLYFSRLRGS